MFITSFDSIWDLEDLFRRFDAELIDIELISSLDKSLSEAHVEPWYINDVLTNLINKIRNDKDKKDSITEYVERYAEIFERWDKDSSKTEDKEVNYHDQQLIKIYKSLSDPEVSMYDKYDTAFIGHSPISGKSPSILLVSTSISKYPLVTGTISLVYSFANLFL